MVWVAGEASPGLQAQAAESQELSASEVCSYGEENRLKDRGCYVF